VTLDQHKRGFITNVQLNMFKAYCNLKYLKNGTNLRQQEASFKPPTLGFGSCGKDTINVEQTVALSDAQARLTGNYHENCNCCVCG